MDEDEQAEIIKRSKERVFILQRWTGQVGLGSPSLPWAFLVYLVSYGLLALILWNDRYFTCILHSVRHPVGHSSSDSSSRHSSSDHSSPNLQSTSAGPSRKRHSSSRHSSSDHSSPNLQSTSAGPSRKRRRSPMTFVPALPLVFRALSPVRADLIPPPKRVRDIGYLADVEVDPKETRVERVAYPAMPEDIPEPAQEGAAEVTYETLGDLVQRFHDHTQAIPVHRIQTTEGIQREQGRRIVGVESAVIALTERVAELERDN
nr:hypothetical protein [Tanacetum cinerariifolium]